MLFGCRHNCVYRAELSAELALVEGHAAFDEREQRVILADADIAARIEFGAALAHEDVARNGDFAAELLHAETTACRIATVARRTDRSEEHTSELQSLMRTSYAVFC